MEELQVQLERYGAALKTPDMGSQESVWNIVLQKELDVARSDVERLQRESVCKREQLEFFEYELSSKNAELDDIKHDLHDKLKRVVELEVDLETHNDRYNEALAEYVKHETARLFEQDDTNAALMDTPLGLEPSLTYRQPRDKKRGIGRIFCHINRNNLDHETWSDSGIHEPLVTHEKRLQSIIANLEARYKRDLFAATMKIDELKQENNKYFIKILSLEERERGSPQDKLTMQETEKGSEKLLTSREIDRLVSPARESISNLPSRTLFLEEKIESLQNQLNLRSRHVENLNSEIDKLHKKAIKKMERNRDTVQMLQLENEAKEIKLASLDHDLHKLMQTASEESLQKLVSLHNNVSFGLENKLRSCFAERFRLCREREVKDKKIIALRQEIVELRLQQMTKAAVQSDLQAISEESSDCAQTDNSPNSQGEKSKSAGVISRSAFCTEYIHV
jgi:chromosome segregation ATPase